MDDDRTGRAFVRGRKGRGPKGVCADLKGRGKDLKGSGKDLKGSGT